MKIQLSRIMRKRDYCLLPETAQLISAFVFTTWIMQFQFFPNPKFQASHLFLRLYRPVCIGLSRKPRRPVFSRINMEQICHSYLSRDARKLVFRFSSRFDTNCNCEADQHPCFRYTDSIIPLLSKSNTSSL